jgi:hypothetical protein
MAWSKKDKVLFRILHHFGKGDLEAQIQRSSRAFASLTRPPESVYFFGYYDKKHQNFVWCNNMNAMIKRFIEDKYQHIFGNDVSWKKLFEPVVSFTPENKNIIPYFIEIFHAQDRVVRIITKDYDMYALAPLKNIKQTFSFDTFLQDMFLYRIDDKMEKKYGKHSTQKRRRVY